jgi:exodeoxyribonuclease VII small subunit
MSEPMTTSVPSVGPQPEGYAAAMEELDTIVRQLDADRADVDQLVHQVARAGELIRFCRSRITDARVRIDEVVAQLDEPSP